MHRNLRLTVVIPCYNEEDGVREVIGRMPPGMVDEIVDRGWDFLSASRFPLSDPRAMTASVVPLAAGET